MDELETTDAPETGAETTDAAGVAAPSSQPSAPAASASPPQQQGPDWNSLGVPFDQAKQYIEYMQDLNQRYSSDPVKAQQYDKWYNGEQQQQGHPYDWMIGDDKRAAALREQGEQHPDHARLSAEFTNFFHNPIGQLGNYVNHPSVVEKLYGAMAPQVQDMVSRIMEQQMGPIKQYLTNQANQQFEQQWGKAFQALEPHIKQAFQQGVFGQGHQGIMNAVKFSQMTPQQQAEAGMAPAPGAKPTTDNRNNASNKTPEPPKNNRRGDDDARKAAEEWDRAERAGAKKK